MLANVILESDENFMVVMEAGLAFLSFFLVRMGSLIEVETWQLELVHTSFKACCPHIFEYALLKYLLASFRAEDLGGPVDRCTPLE